MLSKRTWLNVRAGRDFSGPTKIPGRLLLRKLDRERRFLEFFLVIFGRKGHVLKKPTGSISGEKFRVRDQPKQKADSKWVSRKVRRGQLDSWMSSRLIVARREGFSVGKQSASVSVVSERRDLGRCLP